MVRLYTSHQEHPEFYKGLVVSLNEEQLHYIRNVLRFIPGDALFLFNEYEGEWRGTVRTLTKSRAEIELLEQIRLPVPQATSMDSNLRVNLMFSPLKHEPLLYLIEKATELGVSKLLPTIMERSNVTRINRDKLSRNALEASQQCERLDIPEITELASLETHVRRDWPGNHALIVCWERGQGQIPFIREALAQVSPQTEVTFLIGPEGGFSEREIEFLSQLPDIHFCHLGPRILRAETAATFVLAAFQMVRTPLR